MRGAPGLLLALQWSGDRLPGQHPVCNVVSLATIEDRSFIIYLLGLPGLHHTSFPLQQGSPPSIVCWFTAGNWEDGDQRVNYESEKTICYDPSSCSSVCCECWLHVGYPRCVRPPDQTVVASPLHLPCHLANLSGRQGWGGQSLT